MKIRKYLSASGLFKLVRSSFEQIKDHRTEQAEIALADVLMCGFVLFFLKEPSLLAFDDRRRDDPENLHSIYQIEQIACDTQLRTILDDVESESLRPAFKEIFRALQRGKELEAFQFLEGHYLLSPTVRAIFPRIRFTIRIAWRNICAMERRSTITRCWGQRLYILSAAR